jgi:hypothetical protein
MPSSGVADRLLHNMTSKTSQTLFLTAVLGAMLTGPGLAQARRTAQNTDPDARELGRAWSAFAEGRLDEAGALAEKVAAASPTLGHEASGLLIRIEAGRERVQQALAAYERWLQQARREDRFLLHPVAHRVLATLGRSKDPAVREAANDRLVRAGLAAPPDQAPGNRPPDQNVPPAGAPGEGAVRVGQVKALAAAGAASIPELTALLTNRAPDVRAAAIEALGTIGGPGAVTALQGVRNDPDPYVRLRAAVGLAQAGDPDALSTVTTALNHPVADIRLTAAEAFRDNPTDLSRAAVRSALTDGNPLTRARAAALLGDSEEGTRALVDLLNSENPTVREGAARAVEERFAENVGLIRSLLGSPDPWLQLYGAGALLAPGPAR